MQFRIAPALIIFIGSYLPLSIILLAQNFDFSALRRAPCWPPGLMPCEVPLQNPEMAIGFFTFTLACFGVTLYVLRSVQPQQDITIIEADYVPTDLMNYTLPYVVSFVSIEYHETGKFIGFLIFLGWMFWISYKSGQIILNPLLIALGWRLYSTSYHFMGSPDIHKTKALVHGYLTPGNYKQWPIQDIQIIKP